MKGPYDLTLEFSPEDFRAMMVRSAIAAGVVSPPEALRASEFGSGDSLATALQSVGLKLESRKAPLEVLVVDQVLKTPTPRARCHNASVMRRGVLVVTAALTVCARDPFPAQRERMVREQIEARGIRNAAILKSMRDTPRELFMPPDVRELAYDDRPAPIGYQQTISQPYIVAFMTETLDVRNPHRVLEIGTGSGYQAAILSPLAREVYTIEIVPQLAKSASETLKRLGFRNVFVREGDGYHGWPEKAPFDRIILTAAPAELPQTLVDQLKPQGKLLAPVGRDGFAQELMLVEKAADGKVTSRAVLPVRFVPMVKPSAK